MQNRMYQSKNVQGEFKVKEMPFVRQTTKGMNIYIIFGSHDEICKKHKKWILHNCHYCP